MKIGLARTDITPPLGTLLCGQLTPLPAAGVESPLHATAMCLDDGRTRVLLCGCDILAVTNELAAEISADVERASGVPAENVILATTHTHSGPNTIYVFGTDADRAYLGQMKRGIVEAMTQAAANTVPGKLQVAGGDCEGYAFNRRFVMSDGTIQTHPLKLDPHIVEPEGPDSTHLDVLHAADEGGRPLGGAVGFGCHATVMPRDNDHVSPDFAGCVSAELARRLGDSAKVLFLQGAQGNVCQVNPMDDSRTEVGLPWAQEMGRAISGRAVELIDRGAAPAAGPLRTATRTLSIPRRRIPAELVAWASRHQPAEAEPPVLSNYGVERFGRIAPPLVSLQVLFESRFWADFYANEILTLVRARAAQPSLEFTARVVAQDNWALVPLPCELFAEWADAIRQTSPFDHTIVVSLANGWNGYVPTETAFQRKGGYETKEVTSTLLDPCAGRMILAAVQDLLGQAKSTAAAS